MKKLSKIFEVQIETLFHIACSALIIAVNQVSLTNQNVLTGPDYCQQPREPRSGLCYFSVLDQPRNFEEASKVCAGFGGRLPTILSQYTMNFITQNSRIFEFFTGEVWIGLRDAGNNGIYTWTDGLPLDFTLGDTPLIGRCGIYVPNTATWDFVSCSDEYIVICELATTDCNLLDTYNQSHADKGLRADAITGGSFADEWEFSCEEGYIQDSGVWQWQCVHTADDPSNLYQPSNTYLPVCREKTCDVSITNGSAVSQETMLVSLVGKTGEDVEVICEEGFNISTVDSLITVLCGSDAAWTNAPQCNPYPCNESLIVASTNLTIGDIGVYESGQDVRGHLMCDEGYILTLIPDMPSQMVCNVTGYWLNQPTCEPNTCTSVVVARGAVTLGVPDQRTTGTSFTVTCDNGYDLVMDPAVTDTLICDTTGIWTQASSISCSPFACDAASLSVVDAKQTTFPQGLFVTGMAPMVTCEDGHYLDPDPPEPALCTSAGATWSNKPECLPNICGSLSLANGALTPSTSGQTTKSLVQVICNTGYTRNTTTQYIQIICSNNGQLINPTFPACLPNQCLDLAQPNMERVIFPGYINMTGATPEVVCEVGFHLDTATLTTAECDQYGDWINPPACDPNDCTELTIPNGMLDPRMNVQSNDLVNVTCDEVYFKSFTGTLRVKCSLNGTLLNPLACQGHSCTSTQILNAKTVVFDSNIPRSGSPITVQCNEGYTLEPEEVTPPQCFSNGTWHNKPVCRPNLCSGDSWTIINGAPNAVTFSQYPVFSGMTPTVICLPGYQVTPRPAVCLPDGSWSNLPICSTGDCEPISIQNGQPDRDGYMFGDRATIICDEEYHAEPENDEGTMNCGIDGQWINMITCEPNRCTSLDIPNTPVGGVAFSSLPVLSGNTVTVTCSPGYELSPNPPEVITCLQDGSWERKPVCKEGQCDMLRVTDGFVTYNGGVFGDIAEITCREAYHIDDNLLGGVGTSTCGSDLKWTPPHTCNVNNCETLVVENGRVEPSIGRTTDEAVDITCNPGLVLQSFKPGENFEVKCGRHSTWINQPSCVEPGNNNGGGTGSGGGPDNNNNNTNAVPCVGHGVVNANTDPAQPLSSAPTTFSCSEGYSISGPVTATCNTDGSWSGVNLPSCQPNQCSSSEIDNGRVTSGLVRTDDSDIQVTCDTGRALVPPTFKPPVCTDSGTWPNKPECLNCGECVERHDSYTYPGNLQKFDDTFPDPSNMNQACSAFGSYDSCWKTLSCVNLPTDTDWDDSRSQLTWLCQNLQGLVNYGNCLEDEIKAASSNDLAQCKEELVAMENDDEQICVANEDYFECLGDLAKQGCSDQAAALLWFRGYTNNVRRVQKDKCEMDSSAAIPPRSALLHILCLLIVRLQY